MGRRDGKGGVTEMGYIVSGERGEEQRGGASDSGHCFMCSPLVVVPVLAAAR